MRTAMIPLASAAAAISAAWLALGLAAAAAPPASASAASAVEAAADSTTALTPVESFYLVGRFHDFDALDDDSLIVWVTPFRPFLIEVAFPSPELTTAATVGLSSFGDRVYTKFDSVRIDGLRYPIAGIYELTREDAKRRAKS